MNKENLKCIELVETSVEAGLLISSVQAFMVDRSEGSFSEDELNHLRVVIRLTVEFLYYRKMNCTHRSCATYMSESIFSGVESYCRVTRAYHVLRGATDSRIDWGTFSLHSLKTHFDSKYDQFDRETKFSEKCRLLLDLFKVQIVFAGSSFD